MSEMPEEIWAYVGEITSCRYWTPYQELGTKYTRADLCNDKKQDKTVEVLKAVRDAMQEVIRISDRKTDAWDKAKEQLAALDALIEGK